MNENRGIELGEDLGILTKPTIEQLTKIKEQREAESKALAEEKRRIKLAIELGVCPGCGDPLKDELVEKLQFPEKKFFGLITSTEKKWKFRKVCSTTPSHCTYTRDKIHATIITPETEQSEWIGNAYY